MLTDFIARLREMTVSDHPFVEEPDLAPAIPALVAYSHTTADWLEDTTRAVGEIEGAEMAAAVLMAWGTVLKEIAAVEQNPVAALLGLLGGLSAAPSTIPGPSAPEAPTAPADAS